MIRSYKYRIYPTKSQITILNNTFEICRKVYNNTLALRKNAWGCDHKSLTLFDTHYYLKQWKIDQPELKTVYSQVLQHVQFRVDFAFQAFFRRLKSGETPGYPRFKGRGRYNSITYPQWGNGGTKIDSNIILFPKIGQIKTVFHRPVVGKIKIVSIRRTSTNKWFVSIICDDIPKNILPESQEHVGIDVGLKTFAMLSNGEFVDNPRFYRQEEKNIKSADKKASLCKKGSIERKLARRVVARIYERISNKREDFVHKFSRSLANRYGIICFEDLKTSEMIKDNYLSKSIMDAAWRKLIHHTTYKAEEAGRVVVLVDPKNTSQICSKCGKIVQKDLYIRIHDCPSCGLRIDRDLNAAINILRLGLQSLGKPLKALTYSEGVITGPIAF